jgi:nucleotide-binding universal stress UspA family protein
MMKRILLAYDGAESSKHAVREAAGLARALPGQVTVLVVGELMESGQGTVVPIAPRELYESVLEEGVQLIRQSWVDPEQRLAWGRPAEKIVEMADQDGYDMIVMGHRGHGGLRDWFLGSVAKGVIDHARCSVLVVR